MKNNYWFFFIYFAISFLVVGFSQPAWNGFFGFFAACLGYLLFWFSISKFKSNYRKSLTAFFWFFIVGAIQLSWMTSTKYQGNLILLVYFSLLFLFALQFALISYLALKDQKITFLKIFFIASIWTIFEWSRLFILCGFTFNQSGLSYANNFYSLQLAAVVGIYGLSFYVIFLNLIGLKAIFERSLSILALWGVLAIFPYLYGYYHITTNENKFTKSKNIDVCLVQTALLPEQKILTKNYFENYISPFEQWVNIVKLINKCDFKKVDLIVFPEVCVPYSAHDCFYPFDSVKKMFESKFGRDVLSKLPSLKAPLAENRNNVWYVSNSYFAKSLANIYNSDIAIGLEDFDEESNKVYNAAFWFCREKDSFKRYEKQVLVPIAEYIPFSWLAKIALEKYGIASSFSPGKESKIFSKKRYSFSICYEETFPEIMRKARLKGAKCFVNLTNDAYFYKSKLSRQHFDHSKMRAVENGIPLIRACNTGVTAAIDSFGRTLASIDSEEEAKAVFIKLPMFSYHTPYSLWGDKFILGLSSCAILVYFLRFKKKSITKDS
ncbi:MAG: apolipoprotein N-acyltransferase [Parachlamydiales bacterium]